MDRIRAKLDDVLTTTGGPLQKRLPSEELMALGVVMEQMARRWPSQDLQDSMEVFLNDYEAMAQKFSLPQVVEAIDALRIDPKQEFFPKPNEVAARIETLSSQRAIDAQRHTDWVREWEEEKQRIINDPQEIAWRKERFGYDPYEKATR